MDAMEFHASYEQILPELGTLYFSKQNPAKGVAILVHGLNNKPEVMSDLANIFLQQGIDALVVSLYGHGESWSEFANVDAQKWEKQIKESFDYCYNHYSDKKIYAAGFSLGAALIGSYIFTHQEKVQKYVKSLAFFSPAFYPNSLTKILDYFSWLSKMPIPSLAPKDIRKHKATPISAYVSLLKISKNLQKKAQENNLKYKMPTLFFYDKRDKTINTQKIENFFYHFEKYEFIELDTKKGEKKEPAYHFTIQKNYLGKEQWKIISEKVIESL